MFKILLLFISKQIKNIKKPDRDSKFISNIYINIFLRNQYKFKLKSKLIILQSAMKILANAERINFILNLIIYIFI